VVYSGAEAGRALTLREGGNLLGRAAEGQVQLDHPGVSRRHAEVLVDGAQVLLRDLGSANGSYHNDVPVAAPVALHDGDLVRLGSVVLKFYRQRNLDAALHDRLYRQAMVDEGTGVFNRRYLLDALQRAMAQSRRTAMPLCLVAVDLDRFKLVNDRYGHAAGDTVLRDSAAAMQAVLPVATVLARVGGEEFVVLLPGLDVAAARALAERLRAVVAAQAFTLVPMTGGASELHAQTTSLGVAALTPAMREPADMLAAADLLLYQAKQGGRNRVEG
jgi:two-component system cell cycle response regulator